MRDEAVRRNPYVGLRPFFKADSLYFFGRDAQTSELLRLLGSNRFVGVVGSSGSGKSSLVRAGLVPALLGGFLVQDRDSWRRVSIKPGDAPVANLAAGLVAAMSADSDAEDAAGSPEAQALEAEIRAGHTEAVIDFVRPRLEANANLFVLVDQFEELFAFRGDDQNDDAPDADPARKAERARRKAEASDFVDLLLALADQRELPIYLVLTMRTDFLGDCDLFYGLPEALNRGRYLVPRMTREQLRDAVECPALLAGAEVAPRLLDHILNALGDRFDRLPVLQHALMRTWDAWLNEGGTGPVDLRHFESAGGLERALDLDAESALIGLDHAAVEHVLKRLTDTDSSGRRIRSPARVSALVAAAGVDRAVVEAILRRYEDDGRSFVHASPDGRPEDPRVDISHESLIRQWTRLRDWVDAERRSRDTYLQLVDRAARFAKGETTRLQGPELRLARNWKKSNKPSAGWAARYARGDNDFKNAMGFLNRSIWWVRGSRVVSVILVAGTVVFLGASAYILNDTIETATDQNSAMVASVYRKLESIDGTETARRDLLERTIALNRELADGELTDSNRFWRLIIDGDDHARRAYATISDDDMDMQNYDQSMRVAGRVYRDASKLALAQVRSEGWDLSWWENLSTALVKYAETAPEEAVDPTFQAVIAVNRHLVAAEPDNLGYQAGLITAYGLRAVWMESGESSEDRAVAREMYMLAEAAAARLVQADAGSSSSLTVYIEAARGLRAILDPVRDAAFKKTVDDRLLTQLRRRTATDPNNVEWQIDLEELERELGIEASKQGRSGGRRSGKSG